MYRKITCKIEVTSAEDYSPYKSTSQRYTADVGFS